MTTTSLLEPRCNLGGVWQVYGPQSHTGPWDVGFPAGNGYVCIATVFNEYDARLIASAPDTITDLARKNEALRRALEMVNAIAVVDVTGGAMPIEQTMDEIARITDTALAQASEPSK